MSGMSVGAYAPTLSAIDPNTGQIVELPIDATGGYLIQDASGVISSAQIQTTGVQGGKSLLKPELAQHLNSHGYKSAIGRGGYTLSGNEPRWMNMNAGRGGRNLPRKPLSSTVSHLQATSTTMSSTASGLLTLGSRYTPSSASTAFGMNAVSGTAGSLMTTSGVTSSGLLQSSNGLTGTVDRDPTYRLAAAIAGTSSRGRPRGRRPLRGQFPVVPIDMVRQLGIEQQVILQPAAPVAMRNKAVLCRPLSLSRKIQTSMVSYEGASSQSADGEAITTANVMGSGDQSHHVNGDKEGEMIHEERMGAAKTEASVDVTIADLVGFNDPEEGETSASVSHIHRQYSAVDAETSPMDSVSAVDLNESGTQTDGDEQDVTSFAAATVADDVAENKSKMPLFLPIPIPVPIYVPVPVCLYARPVPWLMAFPLPYPLPIPVLPKTSVGEAVSITEIEEDGVLPRTPIEMVDDPESFSVATGEVDSVQLVIAGGDATCSAPESVSQETTVAPASPTQSSNLKRRIPSPSCSPQPSSPASQTPEDEDDKIELPPSAVNTRLEMTEDLSDKPTQMAHLAPSTPEPEAKRPRMDATAASVRPPLPTQTARIVSDANYHLKFSYGINAWRHWVQQKLGPLGGAHSPAALQQYPYLRSDLINMSAEDLNKALSLFVREVRKPNNECYVADSIFYLCLGIQEYLNENGRRINVFVGPNFTDFSTALDNILANFQPRISPEGLLICRIEEEHLWEARQLGDDTPDVLLFSVLYFNTKHLGLRLGSAHRQLTFANFHFASFQTIDHQADQIPMDEEDDEEEVVCRISQVLASTGVPVDTLLRLEANREYPERCPTRLFKAYMSRCPVHVQNSDEAFYFTPRELSDEELEATENESTGELLAWFNADQPMKAHELQVILNRIKMVKEIQEAFMNGQIDGGGF